MFDRDPRGRSSTAVYGYDTSPVVSLAFEVYRYPPCPQERLDSPQFAREVVGLARKSGAVFGEDRMPNPQLPHELGRHAAPFPQLDCKVQDRLRDGVAVDRRVTDRLPVRRVGGYPSSITQY